MNNLLLLLVNIVHFLTKVKGLLAINVVGNLLNRFGFTFFIQSKGYLPLFQLLGVYVTDVGIHFSRFNHCAIPIDCVINGNINDIFDVSLLIVNDVILKYPLIVPHNNLSSF